MIVLALHWAVAFSSSALIFMRSRYRYNSMDFWTRVDEIFAELDEWDGVEEDTIDRISGESELCV